jgi:hypothetical protein
MKLSQIKNNKMLDMHLNTLKQEIYWGTLARAIISLLPIILGLLLFPNALLFNVGLITISLFIAADQLKLGTVAMTAHFLLIAICFTLLFFSLSFPYLFVPLCAVIAFATIYFTKHGSKIRKLTNFTFIPSLYLACEIHESVPSDLILSTYFEFIKLTPIAWLSIWLLNTIPKISSPKKQPVSIHAQEKQFLHTIMIGVDVGEPELIWLPAALAISLGVALAATLVETLHIAHGEWMIWSVASIITVEFSALKTKLADRLFGAFIGVALGFFIAQFVPKTTITYSLAILGTILTLAIFKTYRVAYTTRCLFISLAAYIASSTPEVAIERVSNVFFGGVIGLLSSYCVNKIFQHFAKNKNS